MSILMNSALTERLGWIRAMAVVVLVLAASPAAYAQAWVKLTGPAQTVYTAPATVSMTVGYGSTNGGSKSEYIDNVRLTQNGVLLSNFANGTYTVYGLPPGTYQYMLTAQGIRNLNGEEIVRSLQSGPVVITVNPPPAPVDSAEKVAASLNTDRVVAGQPFVATVTMRNTGETTWSPEGGYALSMPDNGLVYWNAASSAVPAVIPPGQSATFNVTLTPSTGAANGGWYGVTFQMQRNGSWFGLSTGQIGFFVWQPVNSAEFQSQSVAPAMKTGSTQTAFVRTKNTGDTVWQPGSHWLGAQNPTDSTQWGAARTALPRAVAPGEVVDIAVPLQAPATPGNYNFQRQMWADGKGWFGPATSNVVISVAAPVNNARTEEGGGIPVEVQAGSTVQMRLRFRNTGETTWSSGAGYSLATESPSDNTVWGAARIPLPHDVPTNGIVEFLFSITAPSTAGQYPLQWRMNQEGVGRFGDATANTNTRVVLPPLKGVWTEYDALGRVTSISKDTDAGLATTVVAYEPGNRRATTDPRGATTRFQYQAFGSPIQSAVIAISAPEGQFTDIPRDRYGRPTAIVRRDATGSIQLRRTLVYGEGGSLCKSIEPESGSTVMGYDGGDNTIWTASGLDLPDPGNCDIAAAHGSPRRVDLTYDARNRVSTLSFPDGNGNQIWTYAADGLPARISTANDGGANHTINAYSYNKRRLLIGESSSQEGWYTWGLGYSYDANGSRSGIQYPSGLYVALAPDALGRATRVGDYVLGASHHPAGVASRFTYGNGIRFEQDLNVRGLPARLSALPNVSILNYDYDLNGNVVTIAEIGQGSRSRTMMYDGLDRLTQATSAAFGGDGVVRFTYDVLDNMQSAKLAGGKDHSYYYDQHNRLTNVRSSADATTMGLSYDVQGNLSMRNGQSFVFDIGNRMRLAPGPETYRYDAHGRRVLAWLQGSGSIHSMYDREGRLRRQQSERDGTSREYLYLGELLVATLETGSDGVTRPKYQHLDALGSPVAVTDTAAAVVQRSVYDPYGELLERPLADGVGYAGHVSDSTNGLSYMQQRYYDPQVGRFLSVDPIAAHRTPAGSFNRYWYADNNPYRYIDPDGRSSMNLFGDHDPAGLRRAGDAVDSRSMFTLTAHANPDLVQDQRNSTRYTDFKSSESLDRARSDFGLKRGQTVFMAACHLGVAPIGLNKSIGQLWADLNDSTVYAPSGFVMYPTNYSGGPVTLRVNMQQDGKGAPGVWNRLTPGGTGSSGPAIKTIRFNANGSTTITFAGSQTGSRLPLTQTIGKPK